MPVAQFAAGDTLPCPQCDPQKKHFWVAVAEVMAVNIIPNLVSRSSGAGVGEVFPRELGQQPDAALAVG